MIKSSMLKRWAAQWRVRLPLSGACLLAVLQRLPALPFSSWSEAFTGPAASASILRPLAGMLGALGAVQTLAGATSTTTAVPLVSSSPSPLQVNTGTAISPVAFGVNSNQPLPGSWQLEGGLPPGLAFSGRTTNGLVNGQNAILTGTPTTGGTYNLNMVAWSLANGQGSSSPIFTFQIIVTAIVVAPKFTVQPVDTSVVQGQTIDLIALASGSPTWQWQKNGVAIPGATSSVLMVTNAQFSDAGTYTAVATNSAGTLTSNPAVLTVLSPAPTFAQQPVSQTLSGPGTVVFNASASAGASYQWLVNGVPLAGATAARLVISNASAANAGTYTVTATTAGGSVTSQPATLGFVTTSNLGRLINLSVMTLTAPGSPITVGFVTGGGGTSGNQTLLLRGIGPALAGFGITTAIPDPTLTLFSGTAVFSFDDNWGANQSAVLAADSATGAFALSNPASLDSAMVATLAKGNYSAQIASNTTASGVALAEVYDDTAAGTYAPALSRLINLSCLTQVSSGGTLTAGFVVGGTASKTVLIRASGPALTQFGITSGMPDPQLTLFDSSGNTLAANSAWGGDPQISAVSTAVSAFLINNPASHDAVLLMTLAPGGYSAQISSAAGNGGSALVEVYEVP